MISYLNYPLDGGYGQWGNWVYVLGSRCSVSCGNNGVQAMTRSRLCNNPTRLSGGKDCAISGLTETKNDVCQNTPPPCGGKYSQNTNKKTLQH